MTQALPVDRIRRAGRGRGQDLLARAIARKAARHGHRPATDRRHARPDLAVFGAPAAGERQAARGAVSRRRCRKAPTTTSSSRRVKANEIIRGKLLSEDGTLALIVLALDPEIVGNKRADHGHRRNPQDHGRRSRRHRAHAAAVRRAGDAARNPQRGRARRADLQHRSAFLAGCLIAILFFRRVSFMIVAAVSAAARDPAGARRARLARFQPQHVPQRDDAADHGHQLLRQMQLTFAARDRLIAGEDKCSAFRNARAGRRPGLRADPRHRRRCRSSRCSSRDSDLIRTFGEAGPDRHASSRWSRCCRWCRCSACCWCATKQVFAARSRAPDRRRRRAAPLLRLDRGAHGRPSRAVQPDRAAGRRRLSASIYANLEPRYRLADQVPDQRAGGGRPASRLDAKLTGANPIDVLIEFPKGESLYDRRKRWRPSPTVHATVEKQAGVGNVWSLETLRRWLAEKAGTSRRRDPEAICRPAARASGAPLHLRRAGCGGGLGPRARSRFQRDPAGRRQARQARSTRCAPRIRATRSPSPACRRSPRATAPT